MSKMLTKAELYRIVRVGQRLFAKIQKTNKLPEGGFIMINCDRKSTGYGQFVCARFSGEASEKFSIRFGRETKGFLREIEPHPVIGM